MPLEMKVRSWWSLFPTAHNKHKVNSIQWLLTENYKPGSFVKLSAINIREVIASCFNWCPDECIKKERQNSSAFPYHYHYTGCYQINPMLMGKDSKQGIYV